MISDVHVEPDVDCFPTDDVLRKYRSLFEGLKTDLTSDLGIFWEFDSAANGVFLIEESFKKEKNDLKKEIDGIEIQDFFESVCLVLENFECEIKLPRTYFINYLASFLKNHEVDIIDADCFRRILRLSRKFFKSSAMSYVYRNIARFLIFKKFAPEALVKFDFIFAPKSRDAEDLGILYSYFLSYKTAALNLISNIEFEKFTRNMYEYKKMESSKDTKNLDALLDSIYLIIDELDYLFVVQLVECQTKMKISGFDQSNNFRFTYNFN